MKHSHTFLILGTIFVAGCSGSAGPLSFSEQFAQETAFFEHVENNQSITPIANLPNTASAVYTGAVGMTVDIDGTPDASVTAAGGDFRAAADLTVNVDFLAGNIDGTINNFTADEGHNMSGQLTMPSTVFIDNTFTVPYSGNLNLDGHTLMVTGGTTVNGQFKGPNGEFFWAFHTGNTSYDDGGGVQTGTIDGGMTGQLQ